MGLGFQLGLDLGVPPFLLPYSASSVLPLLFGFAFAFLFPLFFHVCILFLSVTFLGFYIFNQRSQKLISVILHSLKVFLMISSSLMTLVYFIWLFHVFYHTLSESLCCSLWVYLLFNGSSIIKGNDLCSWRKFFSSWAILLES